MLLFLVPKRPDALRRGFARKTQKTQQYRPALARPARILQVCCWLLV